MTDLPVGWECVRLDEVAEVRLGRQRSPKNHAGDHMRPYLRAANVSWDGLNLGDVKSMNFTDSEAEIYRLRPGDVVLGEASGSAGEVGKPALWNGEIEDCCFQNTLIRIRSHGVDPNFLVHLFRHEALRGAFVGEARGVGIHHLGAARMSSWSVPVPPLAEQRRIVAALEDHLATLEMGRDSVKSAHARLARWSESVSETLLRDIAPRERIGGLIQEPLRNGHSARASSDGGGIRTLTLTAVTNNEFTETNTKITTASANRVADLWLRAGDILVERSNTPDLVGTSAIYSGPEHWAIFPDLMIRVRVNENLVPEFAALALASRRVRDYFRRSAKGLAGSMPKIDQSTILNAEIPVPSLDQQRQIVSRAVIMRSSLTPVSDTISKTSKRCHALHRALLTEAFSGGLVPQDPGDEPAAELLARIRAGRAAEPKRRTRRAARPVQKETLL